jgi:hypothetical protein
MMSQVQERGKCGKCFKVYLFNLRF